MGIRCQTTLLQLMNELRKMFLPLELILLREMNRLANFSASVAPFSAIEPEEAKMSCEYLAPPILLFAYP